MSNPNDLAERARKNTPSDHEISTCWALLIKGIEVGWLDEEELSELLDHLRNRRDFGVEELLFAHVGEQLRVSFVGEQVTCSPSALIAALNELVLTRSP